MCQGLREVEFPGHPVAVCLDPPAVPRDPPAECREPQGRPWVVHQVSIVRVPGPPVLRLAPVPALEVPRGHRFSRGRDPMWAPDLASQVDPGRQHCRRIGPGQESAPEPGSGTGRQRCPPLARVPEQAALWDHVQQHDRALVRVPEQAWDWESLRELELPIDHQHCRDSAPGPPGRDSRIRVQEFRIVWPIARRRSRTDGAV